MVWLNLQHDEGIVRQARRSQLDRTENGGRTQIQYRLVQEKCYPLHCDEAAHFFQRRSFPCDI